jgi:hypothetical protein
MQVHRKPSDYCQPTAKKRSLLRRNENKLERQLPPPMRIANGDNRPNFTAVVPDLESECEKLPPVLEMVSRLEEKVHHITFDTV